MKICFPTATKQGIDGTVFGHFGSAPHFVIVDTETEVTESVDNCDGLAPHAGCNPFKALFHRQLDGLIVGGLGDGMLEMLNMGGHRVYQAESESIRENIELFKQNSLCELQTQQSAEAGMCSGTDAEHGCSHSGHDH